MGYQIRVVPEVEAWLAALHQADPPLAGVVDDAVTALRLAGDSLGEPLVVPLGDGLVPPPPEQSYQRQLESLARAFRGVEAWLAGLRARSAVFSPVADEAMRALRALGQTLGPLFAVPPGTGFAREQLDFSFQQQLEMLTRVRRGVADMATSRKRAELQAEALRERVASLHGQLEEAVRDGRDDDAAQIQDRAQLTAGKLSEVQDQLTALIAEEQKLSKASQRLQAKIDAFRARKEAVKASWRAGDVAEAERLIDEALAEPVPLMELRPGAPGEIRARILFAISPADTAVLLAAGAEADWVCAWQAHSAAASRTRLARGEQ